MVLSLYPSGRPITAALRRFVSWKQMLVSCQCSQGNLRPQCPSLSARGLRWCLSCGALGCAVECCILCLVHPPVFSEGRKVFSRLSGVSFASVGLLCQPHVPGSLGTTDSGARCLWHCVSGCVGGGADLCFRDRNEAFPAFAELTSCWSLRPSFVLSVCSHRSNHSPSHDQCRNPCELHS